MAENSDTTLESCPECGVLLCGGRAACQQLFEEILAKEFSDFRFAKNHRLTVDVYALQHPEEYMKSSNSFVAHLTGIYAAISGEDAASINRDVQRWLSKSNSIVRPNAPAPQNRGELTVKYLHESADSEQHIARVLEWARSTWAAWESYEELARAWIREAQNERRTNKSVQ